MFKPKRSGIKEFFFTANKNAQKLTLTHFLARVRKRSLFENRKPEKVNYLDNKLVSTIRYVLVIAYHFVTSYSCFIQTV